MNPVGLAWYHISILIFQLFDVLDDIHAERVPYTIIHLGSIFDYFIPKIPSGKSEPNRTLTLCMDSSIGTQFVPGHEDQQIALLDYNDIGMYVAEIIADKRTFNRQVFAYSEVRSMTNIWSFASQISGEQTHRAIVGATNADGPP